MAKQSFFNGSGGEMDKNWFLIPFAYSRKYFGEKQLAIMEVTKRKICFSLKNSERCTTGMVKHARILTDKKRGKYFLHRGNKLFLKEFGIVM